MRRYSAPSTIIAIGSLLTGMTNVSSSAMAEISSTDTVLEEVSVTARAPPVVNEGDRAVYDLQAKSGSIADVLVTLGELVIACIVRRDNAQLDEAIVREFLKLQLASYKVPRRVLFFTQADLDLTGNAKIKASEVRKIAAQRLIQKT